MSRAEKDAIESMELIVKYGGDNLLSKEHRKKLDIVLNLIKKQDNKIKFLLDDEKSLKEMNRNQMNLIEKQQKEIEELKQNRDEYKEEYIKLLNARYYDYISKDKIKEIIENAEADIDYLTHDLIGDLKKSLEED